MVITKFKYFLVSIFFCFSCSERKKNNDTTEKMNKEAYQLQAPGLQSILDNAGVTGSIVIYDLEKDGYHSNDFEWAITQRLPASTFKIPNSIVAIETGVVENDSTLFKWDGQERAIKVWNQDLILKDAFHFSCVPCYQDIARRIGDKRMNTYLAKLNYGAMDVDSTNIDLFWLEGKSRISQLEQIDFLKRFYSSALPISSRTEKMMKRMMVIKGAKDYRLSGKTGWAVRNNYNNGWFVGYVETNDNTYFFATNIEPKDDFEMKRFPSVRKEVTLKALNQMGIIKR